MKRNKGCFLLASSSSNFCNVNNNLNPNNNNASASGGVAPDSVKVNYV